MLFMVIERFGAGRLEQVGDRFRREGRLLPPGVDYVASWMTADGTACFQLMQAESREALEQWTARWEDLVDFSITLVTPSEEYWALVRGS